MVYFIERNVSIRASLQQRGERHGSKRCLLGDEFQSAPHFSSEANWRVRSKVRPIRGFNPRLTSAARRTNCRHRQRRILEFQSAPHFSSEANSRLRVGSIRSSNVSIRASLQQRGELAQAALLPGLSCFNPRLTSAARRTSQSALKISLS